MTDWKDEVRAKINEIYEEYSQKLGDRESVAYHIGDIGDEYIECIELADVLFGEYEDDEDDDLEVAA
ncbi:MAG: hypothetical protein VKL39_02595, partial [Leptolyngbyaceae bacterium]|nr:hypothetical protein [Leptolyngbyaceae bacterium]